MYVSKYVTTRSRGPVETVDPVAPHLLGTTGSTGLTGQAQYIVYLDGPLWHIVFNLSYS